jgi:hypothetical protein
VYACTSADFLSLNASDRGTSAYCVNLSGYRANAITDRAKGGDDRAVSTVDRPNGAVDDVSLVAGGSNDDADCASTIACLVKRAGDRTTAWAGPAAVAVEREEFAVDRADGSDDLAKGIVEGDSSTATRITRTRGEVYKGTNATFPWPR